MPRPLARIIPSIATLTSLMCGVVAIMVLANGNFLIAAVLIMIGSILDVLDGQLAVRLDAVSDIGKELDSLADVVTFGVAPTIFIYHLLLVVGVDRHIAVLSSLAFVMAGALRLARFNTITSDRNAFFKGMPIPMGSALLVTASFWQHWVINIWWTIAVLTVSYLMISNFAYPKSKHVLALPAAAWIALGMFVVLCWFVAGWQAIPFAVMLLYTIVGPIISFQRSKWGQRLSKAVK